MSPVHLVPVHRRLPLSSRDNLALDRPLGPQYRDPKECLSAFTVMKGHFFPSSDTVDLDGSEEFFDADGVKPADASDHVGRFLALVTLGNLIWLAAIAVGVGYLLAGGWR